MSQDGYQGVRDPADTAGPFNPQAFLVRQIVGENSHADLVEVMSCTNNGGVSPVGFVDIRPLTNQVDASGNSIEHGVIHNVPYYRIQGGSNATIMDPQKGDIGVAVFADRDISRVKSTKAQADPGSRRRFDMADALYLGGMLNGTPTQYIQFSASGINVVSPNAVSVQAGGDVAVTAGGNATVTATGNAIIEAASATLQAASIKLQNAGSALKALLNSDLLTWLESHVHTDGTASNGDTGAPTTTPPTSAQTTVVSAE